MKHIEAALPTGDGIACFNRMYLEVTQQVDDRISQGFFADPAFMSSFDTSFANIYFAAVDMLANEPTDVPAAWQPLFDARSKADIYPIQFALAGMNADINHDLPIALVDTCTRMDTAPDDGTHHADYQKVDVLLDAVEQSVRQSFESSMVLDVDRHAQSVLDLIGNWSINSARRRLGHRPGPVAMPECHDRRGSPHEFRRPYRGDGEPLSPDLRCDGGWTGPVAWDSVALALRFRDPLARVSMAAG